MHARELAPVAALVATHARLLIGHGEPFPSAALEQYWTASKCRQENWGRALKEFSSTPRDSSRSATEVECEIQPVLQEVLGTEILTRVWAAICSLADARRRVSETSIIAQSILSGHLEARNRVLNMMVYGYGLAVQEAVVLNKLRIRNEFWTDSLLAFLGPQAVRPEWVFQAERVRTLASKLHAEQTGSGGGLSQSMLLAMFHSSTPRSGGPGTTNGELNRRIASSILACFPPHVFDATGQLCSAQQIWLLRSSADHRGQIFDATQKKPRRRF